MSRRIGLTAAGAAALLIAAAGCGGKKPAAAPQGPMAVHVLAAAAAREAIEERVSIVASVSANESVEIRSRIPGSIEEIGFEEGQPVEEGQLLFALDQGKLQAAVQQAEANFKLAEANWERAQTMLEGRTISRQEYDQASAAYEAAKATLELTRQLFHDSKIAAPFEGITGPRLVSKGQVVNTDRVLGTLVDIDPVKVEFRVPERFASQLSEGQTIEYRVAAFAGEVFKGKVYFIDPQVDVDTRTVLVKALEPNADHRLRPGMFGNLDLILRVKSDALVVPEAALVVSADQTVVYKVDEKSLAQRVSVGVGQRMAGKAEILQGLAEGDRVITEGLQKIRPGAPVTVDEPAAAAAAPAAGQKP
jgi:membrane fusion protein, multidrug efflux system